MQNLQLSFNQFLHRCQQSAWRGLLHIAGKQNWARQCLENILAEHPELSPVHVQNNVQHLQSQLGSESHCLVIDAFQGFNPNMLGMASATLRAGGILILLTPPLGRWQVFPDPDYDRMLGAIDERVQHQRRFLQRAEQVLSGCQHYLRLQQADQADEKEGCWQVAKCRLLDAEHCDEWKIQAGAEQKQAVASIKKVALGRANRPLVLMADRGRGKSAALGIASAELMQEKSIHVAIASVSPHSVERLFFHLAKGLRQQVGKTEYTFQESSAHFYAIDELLQLKPKCQLLIIDEAAAIPVHLLQQCVQHFKRIVFSTTVKGYEGNGRGFELRFLPYLLKQSPQLKMMQLSQPLRWRSGDPLEKAVNSLLLLDLDSCTYEADNIFSNLEAVTLPEPSCEQATYFIELQQNDLMQNEVLLRQFFLLLVNAHYQTSPDDLRMILDHPALKLFVLIQEKQLVAAAVILQEGELNQQWQEKLRQGRRPSGHLLPQVLCHEGFPQALEHSYWRVVRIAVQPELQRKKRGQVLLKAIEQRCTADFLAASFSLSNDVLPFWQSQGFAVCRLGSQKSSSTGQFSVVVSKAQHKTAEHLQHTLRAQYQDNLPLLFLSFNQTLDAKMALLLLKDLNYPCHTNDQEQVLRFAEGKAGLEQVFPYLFRWLLHTVGQGKVGAGHLLLIDKVLLNKNWQQLSSLYNLSGRKAVEMQMRKTLVVELGLTEQVQHDGVKGGLA